ncbi:MAG: bifunctional UDP-N-acetylglucosamine diphosphorylase/glucosamine-1-phosphate N-acetyltransferase GlmU [Hyphomonadaceae bacterium]
MNAPRAAVILAAGRGERMKSALPKVLHKVGGKPLLDWIGDLARDSGCMRTVVVISPRAPEVRAHLEKRGATLALQEEPLGTAHAARSAEAALRDFSGDVVVLLNDTPLIRPETVDALFKARDDADLVLLAFEAADPTGYGRLVRTGDGQVEAIVEHRDATAEQRQITLCNSGVMAADRALLFDLLSQVRNDNAKGEYYITDIVALARAAGKRVRYAVAAEAELMGVNSRAELAEAEAAFQQRMRARVLDQGVTLIAPDTVFFAHDTAIEQDVTIEPHVVFGPGVHVGAGAIIHAYCHITEATIGAQSEIGPFARLRPGARLSAHVKIGNFVEVKNATFGEGAKASHLAYVGDASVGARANLGAGAITCNYDGFDKFNTVIGEGAFIGSDTALIAPVSVGAGAFTAAGSVITKDVAANALAVARGRQAEIPGWADQFRARKAAEKAKK